MQVQEGKGLTGEDIGVVIAYFVLIIGIGIFASCRASRGTVSGYFLAGRSMNFFMIGASLFVSNIGSEHFIGLAGSGAAGGIGVGAWEFNAIQLLQLLGWVFIPVYIACQTYTMPEYLSKRFGGQRIRVYFAFLSLVLYIFTKCSVDLFTGGLFIQQSLGWDLYLCIIILIAVVGILTITGGLTAVIYTDTLQALLMVGGAITLMALGLQDERIGGFNGLWAKYPFSFTNETEYNDTNCHMPSENWNVMLREPTDPDMPWPGFLLGQTPGSIWYWCSDQVIVQRALAAKSLSHAHAATLMAGFIKILPLFIMVLPGMMSRVLFPNEVACTDPKICHSICQSNAGCTNIAYPRLVLGIMPRGLRGLMMAVMIAALMSDLDSIFNSASTLFTIDIYKRIRKKASVREQMIVGRVFVIVMVAVAVAWVPVVKETQGGQVFIYIQEITDYLAPPIACTFLIGILWKRCNEQGAFWGLMAGFVAGVVRLVLTFVYSAPEHCGLPDTRPAVLKDVHFMYFALLLFWLTFIVTVIMSLITQPPDPKFLIRTTFWTRHDQPGDKTISSTEKCKLESYRKTGDMADRGHYNPALETDKHEAPPVSGADVTDVTVIVVSDGKQAEQAPPYNGIQKEEPKRSFKKLLENWLCGISAHNEEEDRQARLRENAISSLEQDPKAKVLLNIGLVFILLVGVFLYCFWSLWRYWVVPAHDDAYVEQWQLEELYKWRRAWYNRTVQKWAEDGFNRSV